MAPKNKVQRQRCSGLAKARHLRIAAAGIFYEFAMTGVMAFINYNTCCSEVEHKLISYHSHTLATARVTLQKARHRDGERQRDITVPALFFTRQLQLASKHKPAMAGTARTSYRKTANHGLDIIPNEGRAAGAMTGYLPE